jgi:hypothetical protein
MMDIINLHLDQEGVNNIHQAQGGEQHASYHNKLYI